MIELVLTLQYLGSDRQRISQTLFCVSSQLVSQRAGTDAIVSHSFYLVPFTTSSLTIFDRPLMNVSVITIEIVDIVRWGLSATLLCFKFYFLP